MIYDLIYALVGFLIMFGVLVGIGINQPRGTSVKMWCYGYLAISLVFDALVVVALLNMAQFVWLTYLLLGLSAGAATGRRCVNCDQSYFLFGISSLCYY